MHYFFYFLTCFQYNCLQFGILVMTEFNANRIRYQILCILVLELHLSTDFKYSIEPVLLTEVAYTTCTFILAPVRVWNINA